MNQELNQELLLSQQNNLPSKYSQWMEEFQELPHKVMRPMGKMNQRISKLIKNRAKMLMLLDKRVSKIFGK